MIFVTPKASLRRAGRVLQNACHSAPKPSTQFSVAVTVRLQPLEPVHNNSQKKKREREGVVPACFLGQRRTTNVLSQLEPEFVLRHTRNHLYENQLRVPRIPLQVHVLSQFAKMSDVYPTGEINE
jgi:hypothetical protein